MPKLAEYQILMRQRMSGFLLALMLVGIGLSSWVSAQQLNIAAPDEDFSITLSSEAQDAINSGVALSIRCEIAVRSSYWLFAIMGQRKDHHFLLVRHALSNRFIVKQDELDTPHIFRSISEATNYISTQATILLENHNNAQTPFSMRLSLNKFELPGPMRLNAFISDAWDLDTGWIKWKSAS